MRCVAPASQPIAAKGERRATAERSIRTSVTLFFFLHCGSRRASYTTSKKAKRASEGGRRGKEKESPRNGRGTCECVRACVCVCMSLRLLACRSCLGETPHLQRRPRDPKTKERGPPPLCAVEHRRTSPGRRTTAHKAGFKAILRCMDGCAQWVGMGESTRRRCRRGKDKERWHSRAKTGNSPDCC